MTIINKIKKVIGKYNHEYNNIKLISDNFNDITIKKFMMEENLSTTDNKINEKCMIIIWNKKAVSLDKICIEFINDMIKQKNVIILVVKLNFNFNDFIRECKCTSVDTICWYIDSHKKNNEYLIVIKMD